MSDRSKKQQEQDASYAEEKVAEAARILAENEAQAKLDGEEVIFVQEADDKPYDHEAEGDFPPAPSAEQPLTLDQLARVAALRVAREVCLARSGFVNATVEPNALVAVAEYILAGTATAEDGGEA